tara:strand:- start:4886 stop:5134 length:249 start_codon:yes stop_codon:yes gene_type:complete
MTTAENVDYFIKKVRAITDTDYGDFMRKSNLYLNNLIAAEPSLNDKQKKTLYEIKQSIQYSPSRNIDETTLKIVDLAETLKS